MKKSRTSLGWLDRVARSQKIGVAKRTLLGQRLMATVFLRGTVTWSHDVIRRLRKNLIEHKTTVGAQYYVYARP